MQREESQQTPRSNPSSTASGAARGALFVVGVPIGHPDDITLRALETLRTADLIASENPVATQVLLRHHGIDTALTSYGPTNLHEKVAVLIERLRRGARIALVSDCGSPVVSDPGSLLIAAAQARSLPVRSVPGPSAVTAAVAGSGLPGDAWLFAGALPNTKRAVERSVMRLLAAPHPSVLFCTAKSLSSALAVLVRNAPTRRIVLARDLTKSGETVLRGTALRLQRAIQEWADDENWDVTVVIAGRPPTRKKPASRIGRSR